MSREYPVVFQLAQPDVSAFAVLFIAFATWLALTLPALVVLARRRLDTPRLGIVFGGLSLAVMPPVGLVYLLILSMFRDKRGAAS
jgi:hypothetical protein